MVTTFTSIEFLLAQTEMRDRVSLKRILKTTSIKKNVSLAKELLRGENTLQFLSFGHGTNVTG